MSEAKSPLSAWSAMQDGLCRMATADAKMNAGPDAEFDPDFDRAADQVIKGFEELVQFPNALNGISGLLGLQTELMKGKSQ